ncbi:MAG: fibronectin type III domain-containing protein [candidate division WOR-3 bacterium]|nr:MAG: fibronectin type III domain-containing protein [candidate division WOR-3 bacterium]
MNTLCIIVAAMIAAFGAPDVRDNPNDNGSKILVTWQHVDEDVVIDGYEILRAESGGEFEKIARVSRFETEYTDSRTRDGIQYRYQIIAVKDGQPVYESDISTPIHSSQQWFNTSRANVLIGFIVYGVILLWFIYHARKGKDLFIRKLPGLDALDDAVGRATEMGKPILYVPGLSEINDIATLASLNILSRVAKKTAEYNTTLLVPNRSPVVYVVAREIVKEAYTDAGRPDAFNPDNIYFLTQNQWAYAAAVCGTMVREKPATNLFLGYFWAESLVLAETGATTGAIQIAGTDSIFQLPFFITACDYTLIGEELYAASAYLSREPLLMGSLKGQDWGKMIVLGILVLGSALIMLGLGRIVTLFNV